VGERSEGRAPPVASATVVPLRDGPDGLETLLLRRSPALAYAGGAWVWPGGRVDDVDRADPRSADADADADADERAARRAACREASEELGLVFHPDRLTWFSHWTAPPGGVRRFETHLFVAEAPDGPVVVDGHEAVDHRWARPADVLDDQRAGLVELLPPTWVTLDRLRTFPDVATALGALGTGPVERFAGELHDVAGGRVVVFEPDVGYGGGSLDAPGPRHRFWLLDDGWRYERSA
jgi:8-oxo-dGTP pyrophosphatase MutT (NUDIX family)